jgi:hypothetical protein
MADLSFSKHTKYILDDLPHWFHIRKHCKDSIGARYLNIAGLELDDARYALDWAYNQCYIDTCDIRQVDFCYKAIIPMPYVSTDIVQVKSLNQVLYKAPSIKDFFGIDRHGITDVNLHSFNSYYIDDLRNIIYVRQRFNVDALNDNGKITIVFNNNEITLKLVPHQVWNYFDEIGSLVSCTRLPEEPNIEYKNRILDVFKNYANASRDGLINGIARELAIRTTLNWADTTRALELNDSMIVLNSIKVNGEFYPREYIYLDDTNTVVLKPIDGLEPNLEVTYVHGLEMHEFCNIKQNQYTFGDTELSFINTNHTQPLDTKFYNELYTVEEKPKQKLLDYINQINSESPIFWNDFHWNEHYWDQNEAEVSGVGFIPHLYNGSIRGFKNYHG